MALNTIEEIMQKLSRPIEKREQMLEEIVSNAALLVELPPEGYKFPHRTFMEYFAANYFFEENKYQELLHLYQEDNGKWEETLSLFCGLNTNLSIADTILHQLKQNFIDSKDEPTPSTFVFKALVESARINPDLAKEILELAQNYLQQKLNKDILENLGYIAVNGNWAHSKRAENILLELLKKDLNNEDFQQIVMALVHIKNPKIQSIIIQHSEKINLTAFLTKLGKDAVELAQKLLETLPSDKYEPVLSGLREAGNLDFLFDLVVKSRKTQLREQAAWQLCLSSKPKSFFDWLDAKTLDGLDEKTKKIVLQKYEYWGWKKSYLNSEGGKKSIFLICYLASQNSLANEHLEFANMHKEINFDFLAKNQISDWVLFLISSFKVEQGYDFSETNLLRSNVIATKKGLYILWNIHKKPIMDYELCLIIIAFLFLITNSCLLIFNKLLIRYCFVITSVAILMVVGFAVIEDILNDGNRFKKKIKQYNKFLNKIPKKIMQMFVISAFIFLPSFIGLLIFKNDPFDLELKPLKIILITIIATFLLVTPLFFFLNTYSIVFYIIINIFAFIALTSCFYQNQLLAFLLPYEDLLKFTKDV